MKYLLLLVLCVTESVMASTAVKILWPFGPVAATVPIRAMMDQVNTIQKDQVFTIEFATGGGGTVAVTAAAQSKQPVILAHSNAFFINPLVSGDNPYNINDWRMLHHICDTSFMIASVKYKTMKELPADKTISIGHLGVNSTTHFVMQLLAKSHSNMQAVPYKASSQAVPDLLGGHVDMVVSLPGDLMKHYAAGQLSVLGATGRAAIGQIPLLSKSGYTDAANIQSSYYLFVNKNTDPILVKNWLSWFSQSVTLAAEQAMANVYCRPGNIMSQPQLDNEFARVSTYWQSVVNSVTKK